MVLLHQSILSGLLMGLKGEITGYAKVYLEILHVFSGLLFQTIGLLWHYFGARLRLYGT